MKISVRRPRKPRAALLHITCPGDQLSQSLDGDPVSVTWPDATTTGGATPVTITYSPTKDSLFGVGTTTVTATANSADGQRASCQFAVVVALEVGSPSGSGSPGVGRGPSPEIVPPVGSVMIPAGSTTASRQALIDGHAGNTTFGLEAGTHIATGSNMPKSGNTFVGEFGAVIDGTTWARPEADLDASPFKALNNGVTGVTIRNLRIANMPSYGINSFLNASGWTVEHCEVDHNRNGLSLGDSGVIRNNLIHHNVGIPGSPTAALRGGGYVFNSSNNIELSNNEINDNGQEQKIIVGTVGGLSEGHRISGNYIHDSPNGVWFDGDGLNSVIEDNLIEDCRVGITVEIGRGVTIQNNTIRRSLEEGILLSASKACVVTGNTLEDNQFGIGLFLDCARLTEVYAWGSPDLANLTISGNSIRVPNAVGAKGASLTFGGNSTACKASYIPIPGKQLTYSGNAYDVATPGQNWYTWDTPKSFTQWQALPQDAAGTES